MASTPGRPRLCHWGTVEAMRPYGRRVRLRVWICEHPYRTVKQGPDPECAGCRWAFTAAHAAAMTDFNPLPPAA